MEYSERICKQSVMVPSELWTPDQYIVEYEPTSFPKILLANSFACIFILSSASIPKKPLTVNFQIGPLRQILSARLYESRKAAPTLHRHRLPVPKIKLQISVCQA